ncbi:FAD-dependent oxidoreductase [Sagittula salina]|uniref:FAD-dependent oxidoreductase n=1 Tax=Sagittula salina TaxID=2820268 RepID=A0A940MKM0_9RHOB|nr:FAD-dependent oxidoreductase [Sagittula salina]MBP0481089.1 FAD-dependent oxidoreductase [Sagittula salina]
MTQRILILGGGFAGLFAARELRRKLPKAEIELINAENYFVFQPLLPEVAAGAITAPHAVTPLRFLLKGVKVRKARIHDVDVSRKVVTIFQGVQRRPTEVGYDQLVVALGQETDLSRMPGLADHALTMKTLEDARRLRAHVIERLEHADITRLPEVKKEALTFCVIGAGFSGVETVGEMKELIDRSLKYYPNVSRGEVSVKVVEFAPRVLGELPESLGRYAAKQLEKRGIEILLGVGVKSATGTRLILSDGTEIPTRTIVATIGNAPSKVVQAMPLAHAHGRIKVDRMLRCEGQTDVWSLGDCAMIPMKEGASARTDFAPPTAQFAVREARQLAENIAASLSGKALKPFNYKSQGALASLGARRGVAEVWGMKLSGFPAWLLWRAYYVAFLPGFGTKVKVLLNWVMDAVSPRSTVQMRSEAPPAARYVHYRAGDRIFEAGTRADGFYTVIEGAVELTYPDTHTGEPVTKRVTPGQHFGERMVLGQERRSGTVHALEDTKVLVLDRDAFLKIADAFPVMRSYFQGYMKQTYDIDWPTPTPTQTQTQAPTTGREG